MRRLHKTTALLLALLMVFGLLQFSVSLRADAASVSATPPMERIGSNLVNHGNFENGTIAQTATNDWRSAGDVSIEAGSGVNGSAAAKLSTSDASLLAYDSSGINLVTGKTYEISYWWKRSNDIAPLYLDQYP